MEIQKKEFKIFDKNMEKLSIIYGLLLILWGIIVSFLSNSVSFTSYIPSYLGILIVIFSFLALKIPNNKKLLMHIVATLGLITVLGGLDLIRLILKGSLFVNFWADLSKLMMLVTGSIFVYLCFMSFRFARKMK
tara:strand:- start:1308 stop:1709 length:402 start_codon:yes stop_codon:yes gene_type:complete